MGRHSTSDSFNYRIRVSNRVKRARLQIKPYSGLEVVVPKHYSRQQISSLLRQHENWIEQKLSYFNLQAEDPGNPSTICLKLLDVNLSLNYQQQDKCNHQQSEKLLSINYQQVEQIKPMLRKWLRQKAQDSLPGLLSDQARVMGLVVKKISIRSQKTRWGSCSSNGTISLNDQLLFLPAELVEYILIHELCHLQHLNHGKRFWDKVSKFSPDFRQHEQRLKRAKDFIPEWFLRELYT